MSEDGTNRNRSSLGYDLGQPIKNPAKDLGKDPDRGDFSASHTLLHV